jgi:hypothetical protein
MHNRMRNSRMEDELGDSGGREGIEVGELDRACLLVESILKGAAGRDSQTRALAWVLALDVAADGPRLVDDDAIVVLLVHTEVRDR